MNKELSANNQPQTLDVMTLPLFGERLIEASAGTGKTYTIAGLYLRLLLGHGDAAAHSRPLTVDEILVVTFTEAATAELRDRIRARIVQTHQAFVVEASDDPLIASLLAQIDDKPAAANLLLQASRQMDEAAIFTIHGFCQRMLKEHAFESGSYFETEFVTDESSLRLAAIEDFWRQSFYQTASQTDLGLAKLVRSYFSSPEKLLAAIRNYLTNPYLVLQAQHQSEPLTQTLTLLATRLDAFKQRWLNCAPEIVPHLQVSGVDKRSYSAKNLPKWVDNITQWAETPSMDLVVVTALEKFDIRVLSEKTKKGAVPSLSIFDEIQEFLTQVCSLQPTILAQAIHFTRQHVATHKKTQSLLSFDDLLSGLNTALNGEQNGALATKIRQQYPLAMIDEFQDTDLMQYHIFNAIYGEQTQAGLLMIGDPKQAIYSFRGADIFTYIKARRQVAHHYTLGTNYRSTPAMVNAVNAIFAQHQAPFIYRQDIDYNPVKAVTNKERFLIDNVEQQAITQWLMPSETTVSSGAYYPAMALACATQINELLTKGQECSAYFCDGDKKRPIAASDIAILVRTGTEAKHVKKALAKQGIASVYLSNRESIFSAVIVQDVWRILSAVAEPNNARLIRSAMATQLMAQTIIDLDKLNNDEKLWQQLVDQFNYYHQRWQSVGVLAMLREFMHQQHIPSQLLALTDGERKLTDLMHIGEILQQQSLEIVGEHALIHWLSDQIHQQQPDQQEQQLRLESDKNLVQIVTIHKSKGLEYNLVFLPFICHVKKAKEAIYHENQQTLVDLSHSSEALAAADKERLAEDLRLLYVALTRAVHYVWLGFAPFKSAKANKAGTTDLHLTGVGYLYLGQEVTTGQDLTHALNTFSQHHDAITTVEPPQQPLPPYCELEVDTDEMRALTFDGTIENNYWITSYSALSKTSHHGKTINVDASLETNAIDWDAALTQVNEVPVANDELTIFNFPRGAHAGTFLHTLFEEIDFLQARGEALTSYVSELLASSEFDDKWLPTLVKLVTDVLESRLNYGDLPSDFSLSQLSCRDKQVEMEFFMPIHSLACDDVNRLLAIHDPLSKQANPLNFNQVQGMLKGFIDLVFVADGKYYVLDYKSNHLGDQRDDYSMTAMTNTMIDHRYDFQYQLYSLALHRLLRHRLADYDFERHFGGVFYLFLRGMSTENQASQGIFYNRPSKLFIEDLDRLFKASELSTIEGSA